MDPIRILDDLACPLPLANVDTDQLIPARFMKEPRSVGYGQFLLHDLRHDDAGQPRKTFILNHPKASESRILVARRNFGAGSSREAAVYALVDFGFRCVIAPSFGDIFSSNAVNNGLLPATLPEDDIERLLTHLGKAPARLQVDLEQCCIHAGVLDMTFTIAPVWRTKLLNGWDDIDLTRQHDEKIVQFATAYTKRHPWVAAAGPADAVIARS